MPIMLESKMSLLWVVGESTVVPFEYGKALLRERRFGLNQQNKGKYFILFSDKIFFCATESYYKVLMMMILIKRGNTFYPFPSYPRGVKSFCFYRLCDELSDVPRILTSSIICLTRRTP